MKLMTTVAIILLALLPTAHVVAQPHNVSIEQCEDTVYFAEAVMEIRQQGSPKENILDMMGEDTNAERYEMTESIVQRAYKFPLLLSGTHKKQMIEEFGATAYIACLEGVAR